MANEDKIVFPNARRLSEFQLSSAHALLSGAIFTGDVTITKDNPSFILNNTNATNEANFIFHRSNVFKGSLALEDTTDNLLLTALSGKKFKMSWVT